MAEKTEFKTVETSQEDLEELEEKIAELSGGVLKPRH